ncbi:acetyl/propionyl/methylcrotonyl-CoA carboxylase subunit alpha [Cribrihabitans neustonicus]|uniref:acetyl/propionyl/methylcrotonyl-CoA carboxylase subunit alpha n=1 Tax=Cribrihabitans neustonicus TaxID=1429085 RepID=UPI003B5C5604
MNDLPQDPPLSAPASRPLSLASVLIANRGEIACRIIRTAKAQGLRTIAVYSTADAGAPHAALADEAVPIGPGPAAESYLSAENVLAAARATGAEAIHPGYGFLSENPAFARAVEAAGLVFIGPSAAAIEAMGNKAEAKRLMIAAGVPCVPGYEGAEQSESVLTAKAREIGLPVMVKAAAGGGGRGMRLVTRDGQLASAIALARSEAQNAFGSGELIIEKAITAPRHVEVQVFADAHGNVVHLGERDCSVQRRHQKVVEEAPCPVMTPELRARMGQAAADAARAVDYRGAGTVEFLLEASGAFYFLEMNTRLQVEHPVTEMITGLDLVALQLAVAGGAPLPLRQEDLRLDGHAIEVRLYAEDPANEYLPATGRIGLWQPASGPGVRVDAGIAPGQEVPPFYDPMLAKIIAHGDTREVARARTLQAVRETVLLGVKTNSAFLADVLALPGFAAGEATTALLEQAYPEGWAEAPLSPSDLALAAALLGQRDQDRAFAAAGYLSRSLLGWASAPLPFATTVLIHEGSEHALEMRCIGAAWEVRFEGDSLTVELTAKDGDRVRAKVGGASINCTAWLDGERAELAIGARRLSFQRKQPGAQEGAGAAGGRITAPMPGLVQEVLVREGQTIAKGGTLAVLEAMKMQHQLTAPFDGTVIGVRAKAGQQAAAGEVLIEIEEAAQLTAKARVPG